MENNRNYSDDNGEYLFKKIFISHHGKDKSKAIALRDLLIKVTRVKKHFCSSNSGSIQYGDKWYETIIKELEESKYVICLLTNNSYKQPWILYEAGIAKGMDKTKKIICLLSGISGKRLTSSPFNVYQYCFDDEDDENLFALMEQIYEDFHPNNELCAQIAESIKHDIQEFKKVISKEKTKDVSSSKVK